MSVLPTTHPWRALRLKSDLSPTWNQLEYDWSLTWFQFDFDIIPIWAHLTPNQVQRWVDNPSLRWVWCKCDISPMWIQHGPNMNLTCLTYLWHNSNSSPTRVQHASDMSPVWVHQYSGVSNMSDLSLTQVWCPTIIEVQLESTSSPSWAWLKSNSKLTQVVCLESN